MLKLLFLEQPNNLWKDLRKIKVSSCLSLKLDYCYSLLSDDLPLEKLKVNVGNSLKSLLTRLHRQEEEQKAKEGDTKAEEEGKPL